MIESPLKRLSALGQSVWFDYIRRDLWQGTDLERLIEQDGLAGMTSNPTIFEKAIAGTDLYDDDIRRLTASGLTPTDIVEALAIADVCGAADAFRPLYEATDGNDGYVSIEVGPQLAHDCAGSVAEARRLWNACNRPNVMVKIPATDEGIDAIRRCLSEGININITLLFSVDRYRQVIRAYLEAMEERVAKGQPVDQVRSVASFFVSRVDTNVNAKLDVIAASATSTNHEKALAAHLRGRVAIANARIAYTKFEKTFNGTRYEALRRQGVRIQRPLWASTSAKDPSYPELYYVEALIAPNSIDTMPPETFRTYRDHGHPMIRIHDGISEAHAVFQQLGELRIDEHQVGLDLEEDGARKFRESVEKLLSAVHAKERVINAAAR
ncbi:MAG: transaldolase [Acidobacteriota bacterium]